jgi:hypothetical protein
MVVPGMLDKMVISSFLVSFSFLFRPRYGMVGLLS